MTQRRTSQRRPSRRREAEGNKSLGSGDKLTRYRGAPKPRVASSTSEQRTTGDHHASTYRRTVRRGHHRSDGRAWPPWAWASRWLPVRDLGRPTAVRATTASATCVALFGSSTRATRWNAALYGSLVDGTRRARPSTRPRA